jgi:hypothetical protein
MLQPERPNFAGDGHGILCVQENNRGYQLYFLLLTQYNPFRTSGGLRIRSLVLAKVERGTNRPDWASQKESGLPEITWLRWRSSAFNAVLTVFSAVSRRPSAAGSSPPNASKNAVSTGPGQSARMRTPVFKFSAHNASENESRNAFEAP